MTIKFRKEWREAGWKELDSSDGWLAYPVDEAECADCESVIGPVLHEDPNTGHDRAGWVTAFYHDDHAGLLCEDCWGFWEEGGGEGHASETASLDGGFS